jgi:hypothetical protein
LQLHFVGKLKLKSLRAKPITGSVEVLNSSFERVSLIFTRKKLKLQSKFHVGHYILIEHIA